MIKLGTFNLNNLFSRFNFRANVSQLHTGGSISFNFNDDDVRVTKFKGKLIKPQPASKTKKLQGASRM